MTVSRVVNGSPRVGPETRARVTSAIAELGYLPNDLARQLRSRRTGTVALMVTDIRKPLFIAIAGGVEDVARLKGYNVMFRSTCESVQEEAAYTRVLIERRVDGVLLVPASANGESVRLLQGQGIPVVQLCRLVADVATDAVRADSRAGAYEETRRLTSLGHRRIAMLSGPLSAAGSFDRIAGFRAAMSEGHPPGERGRVVFGEPSLESGYSMTRWLLQTEPRPTAIVAACDSITYGCVRAIREAELRIPGDISLVALDDLPAELDPPLAVASQPAYEIGRRAAELLFDRLSGEPAGEPRTIVLPGELTVRRSTAPPRA